MDSNQWERSVLEKVALAAVTEQRRARRWTIFFRLVFLAVFISVFFFDFKGQTQSMRTGSHAALVRLTGEISSENPELEFFQDSLNAAFSDPNTKLVIIKANSPGGSPVISGQIYDEMMRLRKTYPKIPLYVVVEDVCASGCYYIASAADKIIVDKASLIGSIGVVSSGFGFVDTLKQLGIERRIQTAGDHKAIGDPFSPSNEHDRAWRQQLLDKIHAQFIKAVKDGRGKRLSPSPEIFSGLIWVGEQSLPLGLADGLGSVTSVTREHLKSDHIVDFSQEGDLMQKLSKQLGVHLRLNTLHSEKLSLF